MPGEANELWFLELFSGSGALQASLIKSLVIFVLFLLFIILVVLVVLSEQFFLRCEESADKKGQIGSYNRNIISQQSYAPSDLFLGDAAAAHRVVW